MSSEFSPEVRKEFSQDEIIAFGEIIQEVLQNKPTKSNLEKISRKISQRKRQKNMLKKRCRKMCRPEPAPQMNRNVQAGNFWPEENTTK